MSEEIDPAQRSVVQFSGGTGPFETIRGLVRNHNPELLTIVPTTWDNGGSTGEFRVREGSLAMGDYMRCLIAAMEDEQQFLKAFALFNDRTEGDPLRNILAARAEKMFHGAEGGIQALRDILRVRSRIIFPTLVDVHLWSTTKFGNVERGEASIDSRGKRHDFDPADHTKRVYYDNPPIGNPEALEAVIGADLIVLGPGSPYTSIYPHLVVWGMRDAIWESAGDLVIVGNLMTVKGEDHHLNKMSQGLAVYQHYLNDREYIRQHGRSRINYLLVNQGGLDARMIQEYKQEGQVPIKVDKPKCEQQASGLIVIQDQLAAYDLDSHLFRHVRDKLAQAILSLPSKQRLWLDDVA